MSQRATDSRGKFLSFEEWDSIPTVYGSYAPGIFRANHAYTTEVLTLAYEQQLCPLCNEVVEHSSKDTLTNASWSFCRYGLAVIAENWNSTLIRCTSCGWWSVIDVIKGFCREEGADIRGVDLLHVAKLKTFHISDMEAPLLELRKYLSGHPEQLRVIAPKALERLMRDCLSEHFECEAQHVGGPGDDGVDILLIHKAEPVLVQVKRREHPSSAESVRTVRELLGALLTEGAYRGIVISTAQRFSRAAIRATTVPTIIRKGYSVTLYNYDDVLALLPSRVQQASHPSDVLWR